MAKYEDTVNKVISNVAEKVYNDADRRASRVTSEVDDVRKLITDVLAKYADSDGFIPKHKINQVLRELNGFEEEYRKVIERGLEEQVKDSSKFIHKAVVGAIVTAIGIGAFKSPKFIEDEDEFNDELMKYLRTNKVGKLTIYDRILRYSGLLRDRMQEVIRYGILSGERFTKITLQVKDAVDRRLSQIKNIILTEIPNIVRKGLAYIGDKTKVLKGLKIVDLRGRHPFHYHHQCYKYAEADKYGMGKGIYKPSDTYIFNPHPQCTSYVIYVFNNDDIERMNADA